MEIELIDKTLNDDLGFTKKRHLENFALMKLERLKEILCEFECCVFYIFKVYGPFLCMSTWINYVG